MFNNIKKEKNQSIPRKNNKWLRYWLGLIQIRLIWKSCNILKLTFCFNTQWKLTFRIYWQTMVLKVFVTENWVLTWKSSKKFPSKSLYSYYKIPLMFLRVIVSDGTSREEVVLKGEAAFPNRRMGTLKYHQRYLFSKWRYVYFTLNAS